VPSAVALAVAAALVTALGARLRDISTGTSPQQSGTLGGTYAPAR